MAERLARFAAEAVERHVHEYGRLPSSVGSLGLVEHDGVKLIHLGDGAYQIVARQGDCQVEYDSEKDVLEVGK